MATVPQLSDRSTSRDEISCAGNSLDRQARTLATFYESAHLDRARGRYRNDNEIGAGIRGDLGNPSTVAKDRNAANVAAFFFGIVVDEADRMMPAGSGRAAESVQAPLPLFPLPR